LACLFIHCEPGRRRFQAAVRCQVAFRAALFGDANLLEPVEDEVEAELERAHVAVRAVREVLFTVLVEVRVHVDRKQPLELRDHVRDLHADMQVLRELLEAGKVTPVVDGRYPLKEVADAFRYLGEGHAQGKVVITV
jgi:NADPH:quinone reductase-like Zn-dependent oxidoreductase